MRARQSSIAIVGCACRLPGGVHSPDALWRLLADRTDAVTEIPDDRWDKSLFLSDDPAEPGKTYTFRAGVLGNVHEFDAAFFGISPREAVEMDPQQRLLLELAWEALEDANIPPASLRGSDGGVFIGISATDYANMRMNDRWSGGAYFMTGGTLSIAANRLSYVFDLHGPSFAVDTACSSSLVALSQAVAAMEAGRCEMALVGSVHLLLSPYPFIGFAKASMLSPTGRCQAFDAAADGYVRGEGGGLVVLKRLDRARRDGDRILGVIRAAGINTNGRTNGIAMASARYQRRLLEEVYGRSGIAPERIAYVEAHGTGTRVGDPAEAEALGSFIGQARSPDSPLVIGSIKTNMGHLEPASGMAGLIKALLVLRHHQVPASLHFREPNPDIRFGDLNLCVAAEPTVLADDDGPLMVGVNSFGFGGTNAHVVLEEGPTPRRRRRVPKGPVPLFLSARTEGALRDYARALAPVVEAADDREFYDAAWALATRRERMAHGAALFAEDRAGLVGQLGRLARGDKTLAIAVDPGRGDGRVAFVFSGNGCQWHGMGRAMFRGDSAFRAAVERADEAFRQCAGWSLVDGLFDSEDHLAETEVAQPLLFAVQLGLTASLERYGVAPDAVLGHSVGEVSAAHVAGALTLEQAVRVIYERSMAQGRTRGQGCMAVVDLAADEMMELLAPFDGAIELAAINSPHSVTLSGNKAQLTDLVAVLKEDGIRTTLLDLEYAFHSRFMDPIERPLIKALDGLDPDVPKIPLASTVTGDVIKGRTLGPAYWWRNVRAPVRFGAAVERVIDDGIKTFVEIGAHGILLGYLSEIMRGRGVSAAPIATMTRDADAPDAVRGTLAALHASGYDSALNRFFPTAGLPRWLPSYAWERKEFRAPRSPEAFGEVPRVQDGPFLGSREAPGLTIWYQDMDLARFPSLADHRVGDGILLPAAGFIEMALEAARLSGDTANLVLQDVEFRVPFVIETGTTRRARFVLDADDGRFHIDSHNMGEDLPWTPGVFGRIAAGNAGPIMPGASGEPAGEMLEGAAHYAVAGAAGFHYGPAFQVIESLMLGEDEAWAWLRSPEEGADLSPSSAVLPPHILDGALQALIALAVRRSGDSAAMERGPYLPYRVEHVAVARDAAVPVQCHVRIDRIGRQSIVASFFLLDRAGATVAALRGFRFQQAHAALGERRKALIHHVAEIPLTRCAPNGARNAAVAATRAAGRNRAGDATPPLERFCAEFVQEALAGLGSPAPAVRDLCVWAPQDSRLRRLSQTALDLVAGEPPRGASRNAVLEWREALRRHPAWLIELEAISRVGACLPGLWCGEQRPQALQGVRDRLLFHGNGTRPGRTRMAAAVAAYVAHHPADSAMRVLLVGHGGESMQRALLRLVTESRSTVLVVNGDEAAASTLDADLAGRPRAAVRHIADFAGLGDVLKDEDSFDLVVLTSALSATPTRQAVLAAVAGCVDPASSVLAWEPMPTMLQDFCLGADPLWWPAEKEGEYADAASVARAFDWTGDGLFHVEENSVGASALVALRPRAASVETLPAPEIDSPVLIVHDAKGNGATFAKRTAARLRDRGVSVLMIGDNASFEAGDGPVPFDLTDEAGWSAAYDGFEANCSFPAVILDLAGMEWNGRNGSANSMEAVDRDSRRCLALMAMLRSLDERAVNRMPRLIVFTGVRHAGADHRRWSQGSTPDQSAVHGLLRVVENEMPELDARAFELDLSAAKIDDLAAAVLTALQGCDTDDEHETLIAAGRRFGLRVRTGLPDGAAGESAVGLRRLAFSPGSLAGFRWAPDAPREPGPDEVSIRVRAVGLNFRDVLYAEGLLPEEALENGYTGPTVGMEAAGEVVAVGDGVTDVTPGDRVMCFAPGCFANRVVSNALSVVRIPEKLDFGAAATIPVVFFTVHYALSELAHLAAGERVLVHGGAGGIGLAVIQYAQMLGAEVYATAGTEEKRALLRNLGVAHVYDSRSLDFVEGLRRDTNGEGVDIVVNSLFSEAMRQSVELLRPFGRFIELGKRDFYENSRLGLRAFRNNISYFAVDADQLFKERPVLSAKLLQEVTAMFGDGRLAPLPHRLFAWDELDDAFRLMQSSAHIGKIVIVPPPEIEAPARSRDGTAAAPWRMLPGSTVLVTGGTGGFGLATARWLALKGAARLVLASRSGIVAEEDAPVVDAIRAAGAEIVVLSCDVTDAAAVRALVEEIDTADRPLRGVVHAAAVYDDSVVANMTAESFRAVYGVKAGGAWALWLATQDRPLEFFVLYSSVSTIIGTPGQANYVAGNAFVEGMARRAAAVGRPLLAVSWGPIADVGYLTRNIEVAATIEDRLGAKPLTAAEALAALGTLIGRVTGHVVVAEIGSRMQRMLPVLRTTRFEECIPARGAEDADGAAALMESLRGMSAGDAHVVLQGWLVRMISRILRLPPDKVSPEAPLTSIGLDSLMAVELLLSLEEAFGVRLPQNLLADAGSIAKLIERVLPYIHGQAALKAGVEQPGDLDVEELLRAHAVDAKPEDGDCRSGEVMSAEGR